MAIKAVDNTSAKLNDIFSTIETQYQEPITVQLVEPIKYSSELLVVEFRVGIIATVVCTTLLFLNNVGQYSSVGVVEWFSV